MTDNPIVIGNDAVKFVYSATCKPMTLYGVQGTATANKSAKDSNNASADYQVPADKKFVVLQVSTQCALNATVANNPVCELKYNNSTSGGTKVLEVYANPNNMQTTVNCYIEIATGNYLNLDNTTYDYAVTTILGVECDA